MAKQVRLKESGSLDLADSKSELSENGSSLKKRALLVYAGKFLSMDGDVEIKDDDIDRLASNRNSMMKKLGAMLTGNTHRFNPPIQLDHSTSARDTVGRLVGDVEIGEHTLEDGQKVRALYGNAQILGKDNVERVVDGRWINLSIGADLEDHTISELTITPFPAAAEASLLSKKSVDNKTPPVDAKIKLAEGDVMPSYKEMKERLASLEKCKKQLMNKESLSEEDAEKRLGEMKDDDVTSMAATHDAEMSRLAEEEDAKKKEELARMTANKESKEKVIKLTKDMRSAQTNIQLAQRKTNIKVRLAKLAALQKITPAEIKTIKLEELATKSDDVLNEVLLSYEKREPVIDVGVYGSKNAMNLAQLQSKKKELGAERLELETRMNMPSKRDGALKRLAKLQEEEAEVNVHIDNVPQGEHDVAAPYDEMKRLITEGKDEEAKMYLKKVMANGQVASDPVLQDTNTEMSALADEVKKMQTGFEDMAKLVAPVLGIKDEELA